MNMLCLICARGGSLGVSGKNIRVLHGKPVIVWAIEKALAAGCFSHVVVSTDSERIMAIAGRAGAETPFVRPTDLARADAGKFQVWQHALETCETYYGEHFEVVVDLDCTNPLLGISDIKGAIQQFRQGRDRGVDAVFCVTHARHNPYFNLVEADESGALKMSKSLEKTVLCRQNSPVVYEHVAGVYVLDASYLRRATHLLDGHAEGYLLSEEKRFDIDSELDFKIIEYLMQGNVCV